MTLSASVSVTLVPVYFVRDAGLSLRQQDNLVKVNYNCVITLTRFILPIRYYIDY